MVWFETILVVLTLLTGIVWLLDKLFLAKRRAARGGLLDEEPVLVDYSRAFFPVDGAAPSRAPSAITVPAQVRKSLAVMSLPEVSRR